MGSLSGVEEREHSEVLAELLESGLLTLRHHRPLGTTEEQVLGSLGHTEVRDNKFSFLDIPDAIVCGGRAENKLGTLGWTLAQGPNVKG